MFTERAFRAVAAMERTADLVLITGDLTECGLPAEYDNFLAILRRTLKQPVFVIPGNHDRRDNFRKALAALPGVTTDPEFVQYAIEDQAVRVVMLDTVVPGASHGALSAGQLTWLDRTLAAAPERPTMVAMHHPPFATGLVHMDKIALQNIEPFRAVIARHPQVERIVCGHHHRGIFGRCAQAIVSIAPSIAHQVELTFNPEAPGAFVFEPPALQIHVWDQGHGFVSHLAYIDGYAGPFPFLTDPDYPGAIL
jgi:3',5'-cyclic AMP phosphodiesterase CpdA